MYVCIYVMFYSLTESLVTYSTYIFYFILTHTNLLITIGINYI